MQYPCSPPHKLPVHAILINAVFAIHYIKRAFTSDLVETHPQQQHHLVPLAHNESPL
jgi:hypothetical protein